jgi:hypothetical protein
MTSLADIPFWYCIEKHGADPDVTRAERVPDTETLTAFEPVFALMAQRFDVIRATPYSEDFEEEADGALAALAITDSLDSWEDITAGAWRVLCDRLRQAIILITAARMNGAPVIDTLPRGLPREFWGRALVLQWLLIHSRSIDRQVLPLSEPPALPSFPPTTPIRRQ